MLPAHLANTIERIRARAELEPAEVQKPVNAVPVEHKTVVGVGHKRFFLSLIHILTLPTTPYV